jgi:hypothetical protein
MGLSNSKVECIWLPGQSGKTRNTIQKIKALEEASSEQEYSCDGYLNVYISANNRALVDQTEARMNKELYRDEEDEDADAKIEGSCFSWRSGLKNNNISVGELADRIKEDEVTMVVCCAHSKRLSYLYQLLTNLEKSKKYNKQINIWIDEADASINLWSKPAVDASVLSRVYKITLVSATYDSILKKFGKIRVLPFMETTQPCYHRLRDSIIVKKDLLAEDAPSYLEAIFERYSSVLVRPGVRLFAPGDVERASHEQIAEFLKTKGFAVAIINGLRKEIVVPGHERPIPLAPYIKGEGSTEEIGMVIGRIYQENDLSRFPFAITGHLCLGRGITFQNHMFLFTHGILFNIADKANAYQTACRLAGNIKELESYARPIVFTTNKMADVILAKERTAINIARHVAENEVEGVDKELVDSLYGAAGAPVAEMDYRVYLTEELAKGALSILEPDYQWRKRTLNEDGFYEAAVGGPARVNSYEHTIASLRNLTGGKGKAATRTMYVPCYRDVTDAATLCYVVPIPSNTPKEIIAAIDSSFK